MSVIVTPENWPLVTPLRRAAETVLAHLELTETIAKTELVVDDFAVDERGWFRLERHGDRWGLSLWFHPDHVLQDRPGRGASRANRRDWDLGPLPMPDPEPTATDFSLLNAQRYLYQQFLLADDVVKGRVDPAAVPRTLVEGFQEAWLTTVNGRLQRRGLPHSSASERRVSFMRLFSPAGILTPAHWALFNGFWDGTAADQDKVLASVRLLPALKLRPRL